MATLQQLKIIRGILIILIMCATVSTVILSILVDQGYYYIPISIAVFAVASFIVVAISRKIGRMQLEAMGITPGTIPVVMMPTTGGRRAIIAVQPSAPPPFSPGYSPAAATAVNNPPPSYSQAGLWTTEQAGTGLGQPSAYSQSAFSQPPPAGFVVPNQSGQNSYWNPAQTS